jgi:hypothetical protein
MQFVFLGLWVEPRFAVFRDGRGWISHPRCMPPPSGQGELISHAYTHLYGVPQTGLRFFTVYGPWGRPDMAYYGFAEAIMAGEPITLYEGGRLKRDFTYIDDIVAGVLGALDRRPRAGAPAGAEHRQPPQRDCDAASWRCWRRRWAAARSCGTTAAGGRCGGNLGQRGRDRRADRLCAQHTAGGIGRFR